MPSNKKPRRPFDRKKHPVMKTQFALTAEESARIKLPPRSPYSDDKAKLRKLYAKMGALCGVGYLECGE